jgi:hypothetical protein
MLIIAGVFFTYSEIVREGNQTIDGSSLNSSEWEDKYDYIDNLNGTFSPLEIKLKSISDEDTGWWGKLTSGITAIPYAILIIPQAIFGSSVLASNVILGFFTAMVLPLKIITLGTVFLFIWGIFKLLEVYNKTEI